jgi:uncharacterized membrane protein
MQLPKVLTLTAVIFAAVGSGTMGGLLFAFSNFVMQALVEQPTESGIRTMQSINSLILNPLFVLIFLGTAGVAGLLIIAALLNLTSPGMLLLLMGGGLYWIGCLGVTIAFNVPLNDALASQMPDAIEAAQYWPHYVSQWMRWNHVRTIAALSAAGCFSFALRYLFVPALSSI